MLIDEYIFVFLSLTVMKYLRVRPTYIHTCGNAEGVHGQRKFGNPCSKLK